MFKDRILSNTPPNADKLELLREHFPQALESDEDGRIRINAAALQQALDPSQAAVRVEEDGYELRWVGKREGFHNAFIHSEKILRPAPEQSRNWDSTGNLLIKGDNLDALKLLRHSYFGQVKLIYIDPPYNTQSEGFIYRDNFTARQSEVLEQLGYSAENIDYIKNIYGARTHSGWLSFIYPRLLLAKDLLREDGVIFISIDDNEQAQLKLLCDEVFGGDNFVATFVWQHRKSSQNDVDVSLSHNYKLAYAKNRETLQLHPLGIDADKFSNPDNDPRGAWVADPMDAPNIRENLSYPITNPVTGTEYLPPKGRHWRFSPEKFAEALADGRIIFGKNGTSKPQFKRFLSEAEVKGVNPFTIWLEHGTATEATKELMSLFDNRKVFDTPKPTRLLQEIIKLGCQSTDLILDFFAGSGTTAEAVMRLNAEDGGQRRFILVQIAESIQPRKNKEAHDFVTKTLGKLDATIFEITAERLRRAGAKIQTEWAEKQAQKGQLLANNTTPLDTGFRVFELVDDAQALILRQPLSDASQADIERYAQTITTPQPQAVPSILYNLLLSEGLPLTTRIQAIHGAPDMTLYQADDVLIVLQALPLAELTDLLRTLKTSAHPVQRVTVYAPWVQDDNFLLGIANVLESVGIARDRVRVRG